MQSDLMAPVAKSPLDSARGRGKVRHSLRRCTPKSTEKSSEGPTTVILFLNQNEKKPIVEVKHVK